MFTVDKLSMWTLPVPKELYKKNKLKGPHKQTHQIWSNRINFSTPSTVAAQFCIIIQGRINLYMYYIEDSYALFINVY